MIVNKKCTLLLRFHFFNIKKEKEGGGKEGRYLDLLIIVHPPNYLASLMEARKIPPPQIFLMLFLSRYMVGNVKLKIARIVIIISYL